MFVRYREQNRRLQVSLVASYRSEGRPLQRQIAGLGSVSLNPTPAEWIAFLTKTRQRLGALGNAITPTERKEILSEIRARIPEPTHDDQQAVRVAQARADLQGWQSMVEIEASNIDDYKVALASVQDAIRRHKRALEDYRTKVRAAEDRIARRERDESIEATVSSAPLEAKDLVEIVLSELPKSRKPERDTINARQRREELATTAQFAALAETVSQAWHSEIDYRTAPPDVPSQDHTYFAWFRRHAFQSRRFLREVRVRSTARAWRSKSKWIRDLERSLEQAGDQLYSDLETKMHPGPHDRPEFYMCVNTVADQIAAAARAAGHLGRISRKRKDGSLACIGARIFSNILGIEVASATFIAWIRKSPYGG